MALGEAKLPRIFLMAGGGTGGHVIPALAVARELRLRGHKVFFVGTQRGLEAKLVPAAGFELKTIDIGGLNRVGMRQKIATLSRLPLATAHGARLLRGVSAVFSMGGYAAGPPVMAALVSRVPVVVMEPNAVPGFTNRAIGRFVYRALVSFPETAAFFPGGKTEITGLPVRQEFFSLSPKPPGGPPTVLVTGGSQGSRTLNRAVRESWPLFLRAGAPVRIVLQTGAAALADLRAAFAETGLDGEVAPFIQDMAAAFAAADLVVCRSGAGSVSELAAAGKPSVLVPFPFAADDHQTRNAEARRRGAPGSGRRNDRREALLPGIGTHTRAGNAGADGRGSPEIRQARGGAAGGRDSGGSRGAISVDSSAASRNNTVRECFFVHSTCTSPESAASA
jgi:UDP-N-acetylglucosamine--N-acetylmuramyl-(pentapeptide) pyrophosphoryl-undecaprenol N-acetylglucosamine transferase